MPSCSASGRPSANWIGTKRKKPRRSRLLTKRQPREHRTHTPSNRMRPCGELMPPGLSGSTTMAWSAGMGTANARGTTGAMGTATTLASHPSEFCSKSLSPGALLRLPYAYDCVFTGSPLCRARASQCEGVLAWERARREFQPRFPAAIFVDERELPVCVRGLRQSYSDRFLLAQIAHRQLSVLPGEMLICAARKALIVTFEMVDDHGVVKEKLPMAGTADEADQG